MWAEAFREWLRRQALAPATSEALPALPAGAPCFFFDDVVERVRPLRRIQAPGRVGALCVSSLHSQAIMSVHTKRALRGWRGRAPATSRFLVSPQALALALVGDICGPARLTPALLSTPTWETVVARVWPDALARARPCGPDAWHGCGGGNGGGLCHDSGERCNEGQRRWQRRVGRAPLRVRQGPCGVRRPRPARPHLPGVI